MSLVSSSPVNVSCLSTHGYPHVSNTIEQGCQSTLVAGVVYSQAEPSRGAYRALGLQQPGYNSAVVNGFSATNLHREGCNRDQAISLRRSNSADTLEYINNEIKVTRNLNRELANVNSHIVKRIAEYRQTAGKGGQRDQFVLKRNNAHSDMAVPKICDQAQAYLSWARLQQKIARMNLTTQRQVATDAMTREITQVQKERLNAELLSLTTHVVFLERELTELTELIDHSGRAGK
ncbi:MAG: hypothetical protein AB8B63_20560 [Granulosicoccus sp.]